MADVADIVKVSEDWNIDKSSHNVFSSDEVITAYFKGKKEGLKAYQQSLLDSLNKNVDECAKQTYQILDYLNAKKFSKSSAYLKILQWNVLKVLIPVKEEDFLSSDFLSTYDFVSDIEEKSCSSTYAVTFSFLDYSENVNEKNLHSDGFILKLKTR